MKKNAWLRSAFAGILPQRKRHGKTHSVAYILCFYTELIINKKVMKKLITFLSIASLAMTLTAAPVSAQTGNGSGNGASTPSGNYSNNTDNDNDGSSTGSKIGLVGLIGLLGLAGFARKMNTNTADNVRR
jgi:hypothetical protein